MGYKVTYAPLASDDLEQIVRYVAQENHDAALKLGYRLANQAESLAHFPNRGSALKNRPGVRKLVMKPYLIVYRVNDPLQAVEILRFWHGARDQKLMELQ